MDVATIANFLLFLGAFGASFALDNEESAGPRPKEDSLCDREAYDRTDRLGDADDEVTADADNLAWFMEGGNDALTASDGADFADLGRGDDRADMGAGNDLIAAQDGNDSMAGGSGADLALGGGGDDWLDGGDDNDSLAGEAGEDLLTGGAGSDILAGGEGNDVISGFSQLGGASGALSGADGADQMFGGTGDDRLILGRGDSATGGAGADRFEMDARWHDGNGPFTITDYRAGEDSLVLQYDPRIDPDSSLPRPPALEVRLCETGCRAQPCWMARSSPLSKASPASPPPTSPCCPMATPTPAIAPRILTPPCPAAQRTARQPATRAMIMAASAPATMPHLARRARIRSWATAGPTHWRGTAAMTPCSAGLAQTG